MNKNGLADDALSAASGGYVDKGTKLDGQVDVGGNKVTKGSVSGLSEDFLVLKNAKGEVCGQFPNTAAGVEALNAQAARFGISTQYAPGGKVTL